MGGGEGKGQDEWAVRGGERGNFLLVICVNREVEQHNPLIYMRSPVSALNLFPSGGVVLVLPSALLVKIRLLCSSSSSSSSSS